MYHLAPGYISALIKDSLACRDIECGFSMRTETIKCSQFVEPALPKRSGSLHHLFPIARSSIARAVATDCSSRHIPNPGSNR